MANKYVQDIRKIVGIDVNQSSLGNPIAKTRIDARKGIAYFNQDSQTVTSQKGTPNQTTAGPHSLGAVTNPTFGNSGGNYVSPSDTSQASYDYDDGTYDGDDDLINFLPNLADTSPNGMGNNISSSGGTLNGITGLLDPETGLGLDLRFDGMTRPPEGWDSVDVPPEEYNQWTAGTQWFAPGASDVRSAVAYLAAELQKDVTFSDYTTLISATLESFAHPFGTVRWVFVWERPSDNDTVSFYAQDESCDIDEDDPFCPIFTPVKHPADGLMQLIAAGGKWTPSEWEPLVDIIPAYTDNQHSRIDAEFGTGRFISIIPTRNAGYVIGETDVAGGTLISDINRVFNAYGKVIDYITPAQLPGLLP